MFTPGQKCSSCREPLKLVSETCKIMFGWDNKSDLLCKECWTESVINMHFGSVLREEVGRAVQSLTFKIEQEAAR